MPGGLAFEPELIARAAVKCRVAGFDRAAEGFVVHEADHQDAAGLVVLNDGRYQAVQFAEIEIHMPIPIKKPARTSAGCFSFLDFVIRPPIASFRDDCGWRAWK